jgi:3-oxoadipate enol-lactonase
VSSGGGVDPALRSLLPASRALYLVGRGRTRIREIAGPPQAPTMVLLHGLGATSAINWLPAFVPLGSRFRVVAIDQRGHGRGIRTGRPFQLEDCADDVIALADELGVEQVIAVGYSMGGPVALLARRRHPDRVAGMVLCATSAVFSDDPATHAPGSPLPAVVMSAMRLTPAFVRQYLMRQMLSSMLFGDDHSPTGRLVAAEMARHDPVAVIDARNEVMRFDARAWASSLRAPAASVVTIRDTLVAPTRQLDLAGRTGAAIFTVDGDHDVVLRSSPAFVPALVAACESVATRAGLAPGPADPGLEQERGSW